MKKREYLKLINIILFVATVLCICPITTIHAEENYIRKTVKVGYYPINGYYEKNDEGVLSGYGYELLQNIAGYAGFDYEYVGYDKSWNEIQDMLVSNEIDMLTAVQYSEESDEIFDYSESPVGYSEILLLTAKDNSKLVSSDYSTYENMRVGMIEERTINEDMFQFAKEHHFSFNPVYYKNEQELEEALKASDEIDAAVCSSMNFLNEKNILERIKRTPYYVVVKQGNTELLNQINGAIDQMNMNNPTWMTDIYQKYYVTNNSDLFLNSEQKAYLGALKRDNQPISVLINPDNKPYSYFEEGNPKGILVDYFNKISELYELDIEYIELNTSEEYLQAIRNSQYALVLTPYFQRYEADLNGYCLTQSFLDATCSLLTRSNYKNDGVFDNEKIAVVNGMTTIVQQVQYYYSEIELEYYETSDECVEAVKEEKVDGTLLYNYAAYWYLNNNWDNEIQMIEMPNSSIHFAIAVSKKYNPMMYELLNYAIGATSEGEIDTIVFSNVLDTNKADISFWTLVERRPEVVNVIILIVSVIALGVILSITKRHTSSEKEKRKEAEYRAKHDALTGALNRLELENIVKNPAKISKKIGVLMIDVDNFKEINDTYGHDTGDWVLQNLVKVLQSHFRGNDKIIRLGGDEFLVILEDFDRKSWNAICEKVNSIHESLNEGFSKEMELTLSIGVCFTEEGLNSEILKAVDVALYHAKNMGKAGCAVVNEKEEVTNYWKVKSM